MRWTPGKRSVNLEDRRGESGGGGMGFGGRGGGGGMKLGLGGTVVLLILGLVFGQDFLGVLGGATDPTVREAPMSAEGPGAPFASTPEEEKLVDFVSVVLDDAQDSWRSTFASNKLQYRDAKLVLFRDAVESACGFAEAATGPFYCPSDQKVYIDLGFFSDLQRRFGAKGDFAQAYVLAHELGHHVQNLLGTERKLRQLQAQNPQDANALSVSMELQADCYAGIWAASAAQRDKLEPGDLEEGLGAAAAVGDDRLQRMGRGRVNPESFTHGSSAQRSQSFRTGFSQGRARDCDTFGR